ncbi:MAG: biotin/lipoyl-binding protein [Hydrogenimonas sp.]|nr:biotin/lipoyl-binding protein [Hydrogenimonas sp.]
MKRAVSIVLILVLVAGGVLFLKSKREEVASLPLPVAPSIAVKSVEPKMMHIEATRSFMGRYYSELHPKISTKISASVKRIYVKEGDSVKRGDPLVLLDDSELTAAVEGQRASVKAITLTIESMRSSLDSIRSDYLYAKDVYERNLALYEAQALAKEKLEQSKVAMELKKAKLDSSKKSIEAKEEELKAAKAQLASKESLLSYAFIKAPIDGVVGRIFLKEGDVVMPGKPIADLLGLKKRVDFNFPVRMKEIKPGSRVYVASRAEEISKILPQGDKALATARVELGSALPLPENSSVAIKFVIGSANGLAVPVDAILERDGKNYIFEKVDGVFKPKKVKIEIKNKSFAIITPSPNHPVAVGSDDKLSRLFLLTVNRGKTDG